MKKMELFRKRSTVGHIFTKYKHQGNHETTRLGVGNTDRYQVNQEG